ncbi:MAG TPA: hypothetical protein DGG95_16705 [Cytophagales bacterium]|jgi:hypothetical protein|nr:hypothetical protein [Cytophagales bacterium]
MKLIVALLVGVVTLSYAQTNDTPMAAYEWKKNKTIMHEGYVVLKSGKRMEGKISLVGTPVQIEKIIFNNGQNDIELPLGSVTAYGLTNFTVNATASLPSVSSKQSAVNDSPDSWYDWHKTGTVLMGKVIWASRTRPGYVVLKNGNRVEGDLEASRKDNNLWHIKVNKEKFDADEIQNYGLKLTEDDAQRLNAEARFQNPLSGYIITGTDKQNGQLKIIDASHIMFRGSDNNIKPYGPSDISGYGVMTKNGEVQYLSIDNQFLECKFDGKLFRVYLNPSPTTVNEKATNRARGLANFAAGAASVSVAGNSKASDEDNREFLNKISAASDAELETYANQLQAAYDAVDQNARAVNSSLGSVGYANVDVSGDVKKQLQNRLASIQLERVRRKTGDIKIMNVEWFVSNKKTGEKFIVYESNYKEKMDVLLKGCDQFLMADKNKQKDLQDIDNMVDTFKMVDGCY